ncbi:MAG: hypothetical protein R6U92_07080, partial [Bacillota bacterium]
MNSSLKKWRLLDKIVAVCVLGVLVGAAFGIISAYAGDAGATDDPEEVESESSGDPFEPPEEFESAVAVEEGEEPLYLRRYDLRYIDADELMPLVSGLGID